jgi:sodium/hydrogen exchanger 8
MPGEHRELYVSTTLSIIIFTTVVCGGLTESLLTKMGMKVNSKELDEKNKDTSLALSEVL